MANNKISFVILYYKAYEVTLRCIESIQKIDCPDDCEISIVLVDNNSPDNAFEMLKQQYTNIPNITLIHNDENLGFAKGNNVGFMYAKNQLHANYIILANSDTRIDDKKFVSSLIKKFDETQFDVAGPDIISLVDGKHQNPEKRQFYSIDDVQKRVKKLKILNALSNLNLDLWSQNLYRKKHHYDPSDTQDNAKLDKHDMQLFGAFLIFGKNYIAHYDGLFPGTFMYGEENILRYMIDRDALKMEYVPDLCVYHEEGSSTSAVYGGNKSKKQRKFRYENSINSCNALLSLMEKTQTDSMIE